MDEAKECPMCGEVMRLATHLHSEHVPGQPLPVKHEVTEWICPECDYFEEADGVEVSHPD
jgi:predicted RNA-binding Zn-ribbon protein involved in translation (DUF1610 family)